MLSDWPEVVDEDIWHPEVVQEAHVHGHRLVGAVSHVRHEPRLVPRNHEEHGHSDAESKGSNKVFLFSAFMYLQHVQK